MKINRNLKSAVPYLSVVLALHIIGVGFLFFGGWQHPVLLGMGLIAYTLGLRHAFDADHIAAIDNTVRKLLEQRQNPTGVGFYFSLGPLLSRLFNGCLTRCGGQLGESAFNHLPNNGWSYWHARFRIFPNINWNFEFSHSHPIGSVV